MFVALLRELARHLGTQLLRRKVRSANCCEHPEIRGCVCVKVEPQHTGTHTAPNHESDIPSPVRNHYTIACVFVALVRELARHFGTQLLRRKVRSVVEEHAPSIVLLVGRWMC